MELPTWVWGIIIISVVSGSVIIIKHDDLIDEQKQVDERNASHEKYLESIDNAEWCPILKDNVDRESGHWYHTEDYQVYVAKYNQFNCEALQK